MAQASPPPLPPPQLTDDEVDDLLYGARAGDQEELEATLAAVESRVGGSASSATALAVLAAARDASQNTPLHMAAANGHEAVVRYLLGRVAAASSVEESQAFLDAANGYGNTALHWAALNGHLGVVRLLVEGPDSDATSKPLCSVALANDKNYIPLDLASLNGHATVAAYFMAEAEARAARDKGKKAEKAEEKEEEEEEEGDDEDGEGAKKTADAAEDGLSKATADMELREGQ